MVDTTWTISTSENGDITADGVVAEGNPTLTIGEEASLTMLFEGSNHLSRYNSLMEYVDYTTDSTVDFGKDIEGETWYRQTPHPHSPVTDYLVELIPSSEIQGQEAYWAVIIGGTDASRLVGAGEMVSLELYILGKSAHYTRTEVENQLKAEL